MALAVLVLFVVFAIPNAASIDVEFLAWSFTTRRIILMVSSAVAGVVLWELAGFTRRRARARE